MLALKRVYDKTAPEDGVRFLVERLWPRGIKKTDLRLVTGSRMWRPAPHFAGGSHTTPKSGPSSKNAILQSWTAIRRHASRSAAPHAMAWSPWSTVRTTQNITTLLR